MNAERYHAVHGVERRSRGAISKPDAWHRSEGRYGNAKAMSSGGVPPIVSAMYCFPSIM
jgi:hypothetical protein